MSNIILEKIEAPKKSIEDLLFRNRTTISREVFRVVPYFLSHL
jgi:hypothetical protein